MVGFRQARDYRAAGRGARRLRARLSSRPTRASRSSAPIGLEMLEIFLLAAGIGAIAVPDITAAIGPADRII